MAPAPHRPGSRDRTGPGSRSGTRALLRKVPEVTAAFWIIKILTTGMGETTSDFLVHALGPIVAVMLGAVALAAALCLQLAARRYEAWVYWLAVVMVAVFGTMAADGLHVELGVPYVASTVCFAIALGVVFWAWYRVEGTLSIHTIDSRRRELFYWATVMTTFALGTAAGDMNARTMHLGYITSGLVFAALIAIPAVAYRSSGLNAVVAFWLAYIVTRPLGASSADWIAVLHRRGGLGLGYGPVSIVLTILIAGLVAYLTVSRMDVAPERA